ncbi:MAG: FAD-binding oxidoreductase [Acidimicrobiales bacterium]
MPRPIGRRQFLRDTGAAIASLVALGPAVAACGGTTVRSASTSTSHPGSPPAGPPPWAALAASLSGRVVTPADAAYVTGAQVYNERFDSIRPAAIAYCASEGDVQRSVEFARRFDVPLAVRSGGHSYGGYSIGDGLVLDVTLMDSVTPGVMGAAGQGVARVGAGVRLVDMYSALAGAGVTVPGGSCPTVGIAGLALGGGIGVLGRNFGLTCDNVASLRMVTADSRVLTCGPGENEDLYWANRGGGGGNFGVVTSFVFTTHPLPDLALFTLEWPWSAAAEALGSWQDWIGGTPDELWSNCQLLSEGSAGAKLRVTGVFCGDVGPLAAQLQPLERSIGTPSYRFVGPESFVAGMLIEAGCEDLSVAQCHLPTQNPGGMLDRSTFAVKSSFIDAALPDAGITAVVDAIGGFQDHAPGLGGAVVFDAFGGAVGRVAPDATAFVHRRALADIEMSVTWSSAAVSPQSDAATAWLADTAEALEPYASGSYQNYIDPTLEDWQTAYYGSNLERLVQVKRGVDPDGVFRFAQSIPTATSPSR